MIPTSFKASEIPAWTLPATVFLTLCAAGCDNTFAPGDQLFALKNPTRTWKIPKIEVDSHPSTAELEIHRNTDSANADERQLSLHPPTLLAQRARPDRPTKTSVLITSGRWKDFEVADLSSDLAGLTWQLEPADPVVLQQHNALSGYLLTAKLPAGLPSGQVTEGSIRLEAKPVGGSGESHRLEIPLRAQVLRSLAVYGEGVDPSGTVSFGVQRRGFRHRRKLVVKVLDALAELQVKSIAVRPEFLTAKLTPYGEQEGETRRLYHLEVEIPAAAPNYVSRGAQLGEIRFTFDHPRIKELTLHVDFVLQDDTRHGMVVLSDAH